MWTRKGFFNLGQDEIRRRRQTGLFNLGWDESKGTGATGLFNLGQDESKGTGASKNMDKNGGFQSGVGRDSVEPWLDPYHGYMF